MLFKKKPSPALSWDPAAVIPVIRASICTGEKVAGFQETTGGKFHEVMLIQSDQDLAEFRRKYGVEGEIRTVY